MPKFRREPEQADDVDFRYDVGRTSHGDFVRIIHVPSGISRSAVGLRGKKRYEIQRQFMAEIREEVRLNLKAGDSKPS